MPELPEVESIRKKLEKYIVGHKIQKITINESKLFNGEKKRLEGGKIKSIRRFGKVLVIDLDNGFSAVIHIKLTGQLIYKGPNLKGKHEISQKVVGGVPGKHTHVVFVLDKNGKLYYNDYRKFGWIKAVKIDEVENIKFINKLGPEPLDGLSLKKFKRIAGSTKRAIKTLIMDQSKIGGIGNIYANDALWLAKIHPEVSANKLSNKKLKELFDAIEHVLKEGLKQGGASELAFVTPDGEEGSYQEVSLVYGRDGQPCKRHPKTKIKKIKVGGRGTYYCPRCQSK